MSVIQLKRTHKAIDSGDTLSNSVTGQTLAAGEMLWAYGDNTNEGHGVLYIGDGAAAGGHGGSANPLPIGGTAYTAMLSPKVADTETKLIGAVAGASAAALVLSDGDDDGDEETVTIHAPNNAATSYSLNLPSLSLIHISEPTRPY